METIQAGANKKVYIHGQRMHALISELFPICRSITGNGVRQTLEIIRRIIPIVIYEIPTGVKAYDWEIPKEWNINDAYIKDSSGKKIVDFAQSNLHVLNYSAPVHRRVSLRELKDHLYTLPENPDWIPYRTSYYNNDWGFCLSHNQYLTLKNETYEVNIDSSLQDGHLTFAEYYIPGELTDEVLITTHICHPAMCNDNLSAISVLTYLAQELRNKKLRYSYRFLFIPGTIGAIAWLSRNEAGINRIKHGLVAALLGYGNGFTYKRSRQENAIIDQIVPFVLQRVGVPHKIIPFDPYGYDERQFCSPGFNLPVGSLTRLRNGEYPEYHSSADNLDLVTPEALQSSLKIYLEVVRILEDNALYINLNPKCEPQLGRRGLYNQIGAGNNNDSQAMLWVLNFSDGKHTLIDISQRSGIDFNHIVEAAKKLEQAGLLQKLNEPQSAN
jgi:aminopeptidase-like protein